MSNNLTGWNTKPPGEAYPRLRRVIHAYKFIREAAKDGYLEQTKSLFVGPTYGVEPELVKRIKARFRNELSFGDGK